MPAKNWNNITDGAAGLAAIPGTMGIGNIAVNPQNNNTIFLSTGTVRSFASIWQGDYSLGLIYSLDGGVTWQPDMDFRNVSGTAPLNGWTENDVIKMAYSPATNGLFAIYKRRVFLKPSSSQGWQDITPTALTNLNPLYSLCDFQFTNVIGVTVVFSTNGTNNTQHLLKYNEVTHLWTDTPVIFPAAYTIQQVYAISLSAADKVYWIVGLPGNPSLNHEPGQLYSCNYSGSAVQLLNNDALALGTPRILAVSPIHDNLIYVGNNTGHEPALFKSVDGGLTFGAVAIDNTHADCRAFVIHHAGTLSSGLDDILYTGNDGGVARKPADATNFVSITGKGLNIAEMNGLSSDPDNSDALVSGATDNGEIRYIKNATEPWVTHFIGDGYRPAFKRHGLHTGYAQDRTTLQGKIIFGPNSSSTAPLPAPLSTQENYVAGYNWMRPLKFDEKNVARYGIHFIWKQKPDDSWDFSFSFQNTPGEPKPNLTTDDNPTNNYLLYFKRPVDFIISEQDSNVAYIEYDCFAYGPGSGEGRADDPNNRILYRSKNLITPSHSWQDVTPLNNTVYSNRSTDIEVDPLNAGRIWICYGGTRTADLVTSSLSRQQRVFYSANYGDTWQDVSKGLPGTPIIKLLYVKGSDDVLFAGTDVGVYRWSKQNQRWECFNSGLPQCIVTDLEINYCTGKLRVSTYGRGIWETDYADNLNVESPGYVQTIGSNTTWNSSKTIDGSIRVAAGTTLTISGGGTTIYMPRLGKITVEPKGKLIIDGARITNGCSPSTWYGIEVAGDNTKLEDPQYQGYLELRNGATLEHARTAISNFSMPGYRCGGIIKASNSHIDNCIKATSLNNTPNFSYQGGTRSFTGMSFIKNDLAYEMDQLGYFAAWNISGGIVLKDCIFKYDVPWNQLAYNKRYIAVNVQSAGMLVQKCSFDGFQKGIYANDYTGSPGRTSLIFQNTFNHTSENIIMAGNTYGSIKANVITNMYPYLNGMLIMSPLGIYLDNTKGGYVGCRNQIDGGTDGGPWSTVPRLGFACSNTGAYNTSVLGNTFTYLSRAIQPQKNNPQLNMSCNTLRNNEYAMAINPQSPNTPNTLKNQGTGCAGTGVKADNIFVGNQTDIASYLVNPWTYYAGNVSGQVPNIWFGNMTVTSCTNDNNSPCNTFVLDCAFAWDLTKQQNALTRYQTLVTAGQKTGLEAQVLFGEIIRGYNTLDNKPGLQGFLEAEGDDNARKLLIPLYIERKLNTQATSTIAALTLSTKQRQAYTDYYNIIMDLQLRNQRPDSLSPAQLTKAQALAAADSLEVSPYAKSLLEWAYDTKWDHIIEELPMNPMTKKVKLPESADGLTSRLFDAAPNPSSTSTTIRVLVNKMDFDKRAELIIRNASGVVVYKTGLELGDNNIQVSVKGWSPGVYLYSLVSRSYVVETRKLNVVR